MSIESAKGMLLCSPYQFQVESAEVLWKARYGLSADEMGLGKSLEAILCAVAHMQERPDAKIVFCVPAFLKANWARELGKFTLHVQFKCCHEASDIPDDWRGIDAVIINYEQLGKVKHLFKKATMIVSDESQMLKNSGSKRTQFFTNYIHDYRPDRVLLLSGTPIKNRVPEFFSLFKILDLNKQWSGKTLGHSLSREVQFCNHFCYKEERVIPGRRFPEIKWVGFKNQEDFFELLKGRYVRHFADDVLELPPIIQQDVITKHLPAPGEDVLGDELQALWEQYLMGVQSRFLASKKVESALLKVPYTVQFVQGIVDTGQQVVVFSDHVHTTELIGAKFGKDGAMITGKTPIKERDRIVQRFQKGEIKVLAATTGTMSAGWTLTNAAHAVFNDLPWVPGDFLQAIKRIHRIGQKNKCFIYNIVTTQLDQMIMATLKEKTKILSEAIRKTC